MSKSQFPAAGKKPLYRKELPEVDGRCTYSGCIVGNDKGEYRLTGACYNCGTDVIGVFTKGHESPAYGGSECPSCGCRKLHWTGLARGRALAGTSTEEQ